MARSPALVFDCGAPGVRGDVLLTCAPLPRLNLPKLVLDFVVVG